MLTEQTLLNRALEAFENVTGLRTKVKPARPRGFPEADAFIEISSQGSQWRFAVEIKLRLTDTQANAWGAHKPEHSILITTYVNPEQALRFREMGLGFLDTAGNAYLHDPPLIVFIRGIKPPEAPLSLKEAESLGVAGLKVVFALLAAPAMIRRVHRGIAKAAKVSIGSVTNVLHQLQAAGFLRGEAPEKRKLIRKEELFERWVAEYATALWPKTLMGQFRASRVDWWKDVDPERYGILLGGEVAAARLDHYLSPEIAAVYTTELPKQLILDARLRKDASGNIEFRQPFWNVEDPELGSGKGLVHPILIYADLLATGAGRNIEAAKRIHDDKIARYLQQDS